MKLIKVKRSANNKKKQPKFQNKSWMPFSENFSNWYQSITVFFTLVFLPLWSMEAFGHSSTLHSVTYFQ
jgi:hypothetical protein